MCISIIHDIYDITNIMLITSSHPPRNMTYWKMAVIWPLTLLLSHLCEPGKQRTWESHLISHCLSSNLTCQTSHDTSLGWPGLCEPLPSACSCLLGFTHRRRQRETRSRRRKGRHALPVCLPPLPLAGLCPACFLPAIPTPAESVHSRKASKHSLRLFSATGQASPYLSLSQVPAQK